jgi:ribonuclease D
MYRLILSAYIFISACTTISTKTDIIVTFKDKYHYGTLNESLIKNHNGYPWFNKQYKRYNPKIQKIGIAVIQDMKELSDQFRPFKHNNVIDLNILCKTLDFKNIGARNLSGMVLGFRISKRQQTSNWEAQVLSEAQIRYAATDAWVAREIYLKLYYSKQFNF